MADAKLVKVRVTKGAYYPTSPGGANVMLKAGDVILVDSELASKASWMEPVEVKAAPNRAPKPKTETAPKEAKPKKGKAKE